jgi:group I intron endonuclease
MSAFSKYGEGSFEFCVLEEAPVEVLDDRERAWIKHYNSCDRRFGYNKDGGGKANRNPSVETRLKISRASAGNKNMLGKKFSETHRKRISEAHLGNKNPNYGKPRSEETCAKISKAHLGVPLSEAHREGLKKAWVNRSRDISVETRQKLANATRKSWERRRMLGLGS